jgi:DNA-binding transcriptional LysR family regulator
MNLDALKVFCDVVRQRSFSRAASSNRLSQSGASQAVSQIERRLGVQLIDRSRRPLALTPEGRVFFEGCLDLIGGYDALESTVRGLHEENTARIRVASIYSVGIYDMNRYLRAFLARRPRGDIQIEFLHPNQVYDKVISEEADLGLVSFPRSRRELGVVPWRREAMALVCSPDHPLAGRANVRMDDLGGADFVSFDENLAIRRHIDRFLRRNRVSVNVVMSFDNVESIKSAVEAGAGISILPEPTVRDDVKNGSLAAPTIVELELVRPLSVIHRKGRLVTPAMKEFIELLLDGVNGQSKLGKDARKAEKTRIVRPAV